MSHQFDVFLAYNSADKPQVRTVANELKKRGLQLWLDEEQIAPGDLFQEAIQKAIPQIKSAAIFIGTTGLGRWQVIELQTLTSQFINRGIRVIPVLLPGIDKIPDDLLFLQQFNWVSFEKLNDQEAFDNLEWGITDIKPHSKSVFTERSKLSITEKQEVVSQALLSSQSNEVELKSERGVDYIKLRDLLAAGYWEWADLETAKVMCRVSGMESQEWLNVESIDNFPCEDLRTINKLWMHYSNGKFGFSAQKKIYESLGGTREYDIDIWENFCYHVGWRREDWLDYSQLTFDLELASQAHLPCIWVILRSGWFIRCLVRHYSNLWDLEFWDGFDVIDQLVFTEPVRPRFLQGWLLFRPWEDSAERVGCLFSRAKTYSL